MIQQTFRRLLQSPLHFAAALLAFALGIGVNTAMYSLCDAMLFHPVELSQLDRLLVFEAYSKAEQQGIYDTSPADFFDFRSRLRSFEGLAFADFWDATITRDGEPEQVQAARVSANWFSLTGATLLAGRSFLTGEDSPGRHRVAILTHGLALRRFGGTAVLGRQIRLNNEDYLIVGLLKDTSRYPTSSQLYVPYPIDSEFRRRRSDFHLMVAALPQPGVSPQAAAEEVKAVQASLAREYRQSHEGRSVLAVPLAERVTGSDDTASRYLRLLLFATGFVLLLACANVANLQLARVTGRTREFAILSALGASRPRIAAQVLVESAILSLSGAALGCLFAIWSVDVVKRSLPAEIWQYVPMWPYVSVNWYALSITVTLSIAAGFLSGLLPAWHSTRSDAQEALREGGRSMSAGAGRQWFRAAMVAFQMAIALVLLIGAGLMVRSTQALLDRFNASDPASVATLRLTLPSSKYPEPAQRIEFAKRLSAELARLPARQQSGLVSNIPFADSLSIQALVVEGRPEPLRSDRPSVNHLIVSPGYFATLRVPLRQGRLLSDTDSRDTDSVCVIDERLADSVFPRENPLGHRVSLANTPERSWCRIVGVVAPNFQNAFDREPRRTLYRPLAQVAPRVLSVVFRTNAPMHAALPALKQAVSAVDPEQPVNSLFSQQELLNNSLAGLRLVAFLMSGIGLIALLLSAVGIFSVISYVVMERTSEIGMRVAMGASPFDILRLVSRQIFWMGLLGLSTGLLAGFALAQLFSGLIWGISSRDFWSLASVSLLLASVGALAMYLPARRAMRLDPMEALRHD